MCSLCRDVLNHSHLFPAKNRRSFMHSIAEVYDHLHWQLRDVLEQDKTCAELASRALSLGRNLVSDVVAYLLLAPTSLRQTDALASVEVVALWATLPPESGPPLPVRPDATQQKQMLDAWHTLSGSAIASILRTPWCLHLFDGPRTVVENSVEAASMRLDLAEAEFCKVSCGKGSGLASAFRTSEQHSTRRSYIQAARGVLDLMYLLGEVLVQFHLLSEGLGDYGMIRAGSWLHPFLDVLTQSVNRLRQHLELVNNAVEQIYVLAPARGEAVGGPSPSERMCVRAHEARKRCVSNRGAHLPALLQTIDELKARSSLDRLPAVVEDMTDACRSLHGLLSSPEFLSRVGKRAFPCSTERIVKLADAAQATPDVRNSAAAEQVNHDETSTTKLADAAHIAPDVRNSVAAEQVNDDETSTTASGATASSSRDEFRILVRRLPSAPLCGGSGSGIGDLRTLLIAGGKLHIYEKGSTSNVKHIVELAYGIDSCIPGPTDEMVALVVRLSPLGASAADGVIEFKDYLFKFPSPTVAAAFMENILDRRAIDSV